MFSGLGRPVLAVLAALAVAAATWTAPAYAAKPPAERYGDKAFAVSNHKRDNHDRVRLRQGRCLQRFATRWARHMARTGELDHQSLRPIMRRCHLRMAGENIAYGYPTGRAVVRGWMHSPGHRANILRRQYRVMAVGAARDDRGRWWASQVFGRH